MRTQSDDYISIRADGDSGKSIKLARDAIGVQLSERLADGNPIAVSMYGPEVRHVMAFSPEHGFSQMPPTVTYHIHIRPLGTFWQRLVFLFKGF